MPDLLVTRFSTMARTAMTHWTARTAIALGSIVAAAAPLSAQAKTTHSHAAHHAIHHSTHHAATHTSAVHGAYGRHAALSRRYGNFHHRYARYAGVSCVPFARAESGIILTGNAATWWDEAEGRYARGHAPEAGSVLNFRANASMHLGHVAVVREVVNSRQIEIDQANWWGPGGGHGVISRDIAVVDVSPHNDWTAVRVALGHSGSFGSVYPTYGFIYHEAPGLAHTELASARATNAAAGGQAEEVAEAPAGVASGPLSLDAPNRNLR
jgi:surface antigen